MPTRRARFVHTHPVDASLTPFPPQVKRCDEMLRKLRFFSDQIDKADLVAVARPPRDKAYELDELEVKLEELERELLEVNANVEKLRRSHRCAPPRC